MPKSQGKGEQEVLHLELQEIFADCDEHVSVEGKERMDSVLEEEPSPDEKDGGGRQVADLSCCKTP